MRWLADLRLRSSVGLIALLTLGLALPAAAHSDVVERHPEPESTLDDGSLHIEARFSEELEGGSTITVVGPAGDVVAADDAGLDLDDLDRVTLYADVDLAPGRYQVEWTAVSAGDGDVTEGAWEFAVAGDAPQTAAASTSADEEPTAPDSSRLPLTLFVAGTLGFVAVVAGRRRREREGES